MTGELLVTEKICRKCNRSKPVSAFSKKTEAVDGLQPKCKTCCSEEHAIYRKNLTNLKQLKAEYYVKNKKKISERRKIYYEKNKDSIKSKLKIYRDNNKEKLKTLNKVWREANKDYCSQKIREWVKANPEKTAEHRHRSYVKNKDKHYALVKKWYREHPEYTKIKNHDRRAKILGNGGRLSKDIKNKLHKLQSGKCAICKCRLDESKTHLDHIMPLALGGRNEDSNIQLLCQSCNCKKSKSHPIDHMQSLGYLL